MTHIVCSSAGMDVSGESVPYVGWGETGELDAIRAYAQTIDEVARRIETALETNDAHGVQEAKAAA